MELIDTHCHLDFPLFDARREEVVAAATAAGVTQIVMPGVSADAWPRLLGCRAPGLHAALGLHPCFLARHRDEHLVQLERLLQRERVVAVGEIGLDFYIPDADRAAQRALFEAQLALAGRYELPVLLHVRKAHDQVLKELRRVQLKRGGIVHAFSGSLQQAQQYLALGFCLGIGGTLTYDRATRLRRLVSELPLEALVLETDAPDMPLADYRDAPNQPCRVREVAQCLAGLRQERLAQVAAVTSASARQLLGL